MSKFLSIAVMAFAGVGFVTAIAAFLYWLKDVFRKLKRNHIKINQMFCKHIWKAEDIYHTDMYGVQDLIRAKCIHCEKQKDFEIDGIYSYFKAD